MLSQLFRLSEAYIVHTSAPAEEQALSLVLAYLAEVRTGQPPD